jgi:hypothetical protein
MMKKRAIWLGTISALVLSVQTACAQSGPTGGLYRIVSGRYIVCCGIAGPFVDLLPNAGDAFLELTVDLQNNLARMRLLGQDLHTVLRVPPEGTGREFVYVFTNGIIFQDHIQFGGPGLPPTPDQPAFSFVLSNSLDTVSLNGSVIRPCPGCADIPATFQHTNVMAVLMPVAAIRASEVEICWSTAAARTYLVQYRSSLTTNEWADLAPPIAGNGSTICITDKALRGQPQRYYRVLALP